MSIETFDPFLLLGFGAIAFIVAFFFIAVFKTDTIMNKMDETKEMFVNSWGTLPNRDANCWDACDYWYFYTPNSNLSLTNANQLPCDIGKDIRNFINDIKNDL